MKKEEIFLIKNIYWERIFLNIEIEVPDSIKEEVNIYLCNEESVQIPLKAIRVQEKILLSVNIACVHKRSFLENGRWYLQAILSDNTICECEVDVSVAYKCDELSRIFKYAQNQMAYNISFGVFSKDEKALILYIDSYFMEENTKWKKRRYIREVRGTKAKMKRGFMSFFVSMIKWFYFFMDLCIPKNGKRILIMSETKEYLWGNLKAIDDRIKERHLDKEFVLSYSFRAVANSSYGLKDLMKWFRLIILIARQDYIFVDDYVQIFGFFKLSKKTRLIQVWHAGEGFKSVGYSRFGKEGSPFPAASCHKQYTDVITGSEHLVKVFQEVFAIEEEAFHPVGMPRLDGFLNEVKIQKFRETFFDKYHQFRGKKIILFAPTYRGAGQKQAYYDYDKLQLDEIYRFCNEKEYVFLVKMHPFVKEQMEIPKEYADTIIEFSDYPNINDLYYVTDVLITDYSSNYFEYVLMRHPVIFYTYDREVYELTRGVHRGIRESAPGKVCDTFDELIHALKNEDYEYSKTEEFVKNNFANYEDNASDKVIDEILLSGMMKGEK